MTKVEYIDFRVKEMSIEEAKAMGPYDMACLADEVYNNYHSEAFQEEMLNVFGQRIDDDIIDAILCNPELYSEPEECTYAFVADKLGIAFY